jgi:hypothetical protein
MPFNDRQKQCLHDIDKHVDAYKNNRDAEVREAGAVLENLVNERRDDPPADLTEQNRFATALTDQFKVIDSKLSEDDEKGRFAHIMRNEAHQIFTTMRPSDTGERDISVDKDSNTANADRVWPEQESNEPADSTDNSADAKFPEKKSILSQEQ